MAGGSLNGHKSGRDSLITEINVTPLVDIMLVLLIIFMVTATYIVRDSLEVSLPQAQTGEPKPLSLLAITIDQQGSLTLNGDKTTVSAISAFIAAQRRRGKDLEAIIAADKDVAHGKVVSIIDLVRDNGVIKFAINVTKDEK
jgi:biopolymer transport protein ExbD